jgi:hypothetical protein
MKNTKGEDMKAVRLIAYQPICGSTLKDLICLDAIFVSPIEFFYNNESESYICHCLEKKYDSSIDRLFNAGTFSYIA